MFTRIQKLSIKKRLTVFVLFFNIILLVIYSYWVHSMRKGILAKYENESRQSCSYLLSSVSAHVDTMANISKFPVLRDYDGLPTQIYQALSSGQSVENNFSYYNECNKTVVRFLELNTFIDTITVYDRNGFGVTLDKTSSYYSIVQADTSSAWFQSALTAKGGAVAVPAVDLKGSGGQLKDQTMLSIVRSIVNASRYENIGVVLIGMNTADITALFQSVQYTPEQSFGIYYKQELIAGDIPAALLQKKVEPGIETNHVFYEREDSGQNCYTYMQKGDYAVMVKIPREAVYARDAASVFLLYFLVGGLLILTLLVTWRLAVSIINPLNILVNACRELGLQNFSVRIEGTAPKELLQLYEAFNRMGSRLEVLIKEVYLKDLERKELTLQFLRSQINPHYLYNTLECIRMNAYQNGNYEASDMAALLGHNLQYGLRGAHEEVYLFQEIESLKDYIRLVRYHYKDLFQINFLIEEEIINSKCIKLMLQPLVENALVHAAAASFKTVTIDIIGYLDTDSVTIVVADDGPGINPDTLKKLLSSLTDPQNNDSGIGLKNVHRRIRLTYGMDYGLEIKSLPGSGTRITIKLPLLIDQEVQNEKTKLG